MNNKEFDQFLRNEVDSVNFGGGEQAWEQFAAAQVDQQIKSEVEAIQYPDGEMAWRQFSGQDSGEGSSRRPFAYWKPLVAAASIAILVGVMLHHSLNVGPDNLHTSEIATSSEQLKTGNTPERDTAPFQTETSIEVIADNNEQLNATIAIQESTTETRQIITQEQTTFAQANSLLNTTVNHKKTSFHSTKAPESIVSNPLEIIQTVASTKENLNSTTEQKPIITPNNNALVTSVSLLPTIGVRELEQSIAFTSVEKLLDIQPVKKRRFNIFGELGIGNHQSGLRLITGVSVPMNSWSVETGVGVMNKSNRPMFFSHEIDSDIFPDFEEYHDYTFIQKVTMIVPLRIKKRIWKRHNIIVGAQGSYNFSNQVDIESIVPNTTPQFGTGTSTGSFTPQIDYGKEVYRYNNIGSAANAYSVVTSKRLNLDIIAGYELDLSRVSIGVSMAKPVFSSFSVTDGVDGPVLFNILENPNVSLSLKYTFI